MKLYELEAGQIDRELKKTANDIESNNGPAEKSKDEIQEPTNEPEGFQGVDDLENGETEDDITQKLIKKVDNFLLASVKGLSYATDYRHDDNSKIHPFQIIQMNMDELNNLRLMVKNLINMKSFSDATGIYDDPGMRFHQDLVSFVEKVIELKRHAIKNSKTK